MINKIWIKQIKFKIINFNKNKKMKSKITKNKPQYNNKWMIIMEFNQMMIVIYQIKMIK